METSFDRIVCCGEGGGREGCVKINGRNRIENETKCEGCKARYPNLRFAESSISLTDRAGTFDGSDRDCCTNLCSIQAKRKRTSSRDEDVLSLRVEVGYSFVEMCHCVKYTISIYEI